MILFLSIISILLLLASISLGILAYRYGKMLMNIEDNGQFALDIIDNKFNKIFEIISSSDLLSDEPTVLAFMREFNDSRKHIEIIINSLVASSEEFELEIGEDLMALARNIQDDDRQVNDTTKS